MAGITLAQAETNLAAWLAASEAVAASQSYSIEGRSLTRANAAEIREQIDFWQGWVKKLSATDATYSRGKSRRAVPYD